MIRRFAGLLGHSTAMVRKTARNYLMLSMTVILSFSVLLAFLAAADSQLYHQYKEVLSRPRQLVVTADSQITDAKREALLRRLENSGDATHYVEITYSDYWIRLPEAEFDIASNLYAIPTMVWGIYDRGSMERWNVTWLDGRETNDVVLKEGEVLITRDVYEMTGMKNMDVPVYPLIVSAKAPAASDESAIDLRMNCRVAGIIENKSASLWGTSDAGAGERSWLQAPVYVSEATMESLLGNFEPAVPPQKQMTFYTETPEKVSAALQELGIASNSVYQEQNEARKEMRLYAQTKALITGVLFVLLGINLYGSFSNALEHRKFEVGVKRAIGASSLAIVGQFLWEGILVMAVNILLSVVLVFDGMLAYKYCYQRIYGEIWTICIQRTSVAMFGVISIFLTMLFSLIFAIQTTRVEVVAHLKAE